MIIALCQAKRCDTALTLLAEIRRLPSLLLETCGGRCCFCCTLAWIDGAARVGRTAVLVFDIVAQTNRPTVQANRIAGVIRAATEACRVTTCRASGTNELLFDILAATAWELGDRPQFCPWAKEIYTGSLGRGRVGVLNQIR